jgi:hypothetical protein
MRIHSISAARQWFIVLLVVTSSFVPLCGDETPLHLLIDQQLTPVAGRQIPTCSDAEFLRRASLDLIGMPPTADEARNFINDPASDKRVALIDRLLASPHYARHLAATLDIMLMERRIATHVTADEWKNWLLVAVRENRPWNALVREMLQADGTDPATRAAARFTLDRGSEPHLLTRDIGRIFFGRDLQCAQCHDHPAITDYLQSDYHGLLAFVSSAAPQVIKEADQERTVVAEKAGQDLTFESVFEGVPRRTGARMPDGTEIDEPLLLPGDEYLTAPAENVIPVPKFSRRTKLAELATDGSNPAFNENIVNRLWAHMFGRGLVHPLDLHHADNPATSPELLRLLADRFVAMNFDFKAFLRELALTEVYGRAFDPPLDPISLADRAVTEVRALELQLAHWEATAEASEAAFSAATDNWQAAQAVADPVAGEVDTIRNQYAEAKQKLDQATASVTTANANLQAKQQLVTVLQQAATALQAASQAVPGDADITAAAQQLLAKSEAASGEVATLAKTAEELSAALAAPTAAVEQAKPPLAAAIEKLAPLSSAVKTAEQQMLAARLTANKHAEAASALRRRLDTALAIAQLPEKQQAIVAAQDTITTRQLELTTAQQNLDLQATAMVTVKLDHEQAAESAQASTQGLAVARAEHEKRIAQAKAIADAAAAAVAASQAIADDPVLADVATKLSQRAVLAQTQTGQSNQQVETALMAEQSATAALMAAQTQLDAAQNEQTRLQQEVDSAQRVLVAAQAEVTAKQSEFDSSWAALTERWARDFTVSSLKPLTPEQLCWSVFRVTSVYESYWNVEVVEMDKTAPLTAEQQQDPAIMADRQVQLEQRVYDKLKSYETTYATYYGAGAGQPQGDFFSTADQALFAANAGSINSWVVPSGTNVTNRMLGHSESTAAAEELYLGILSRLPTAAETAEVVGHLADRAADRPVAAQELVWALLNSAEFRFNH